MLTSREKAEQLHNRARRYLHHVREIQKGRDHNTSVRAEVANHYLSEMKELLNLDPKGPPFYRPPGQED